jgi:cell division transport system ATP-binding protein
MDQSLISIKNISFSHNDLKVLSNVNLEIKAGEFVYLIGKTGSGKSSLLKLLYSDHKIQEGEITISDFQLQKIKRRKVPFLRRIQGIIFQDFQLLPDRNVTENLIFAMKATGWKKKDQISKKVKEILKQVQLEGMELKYPHQLSGGEQQRVAIGRALVNSPKVILADEPTGNLDPDTSIDIMNLLSEIRATGTAIIMATHDYTLLDKFPGRIIKCESGVFTETNQL